MSGGHFNYKDGDLKSEIFGYGDETSNEFEDMEVSHLVWDVLTLIHDYDWYVSGDTGAGDYHTAKQKFKEKWFKADRSERLAKIIDEKLDDVREELKAML
jgi:elongation factor P hydroxylase